jgi:eukaryotic-like serine/threonine-protein kinase
MPNQDDQIAVETRPSGDVKHGQAGASASAPDSGPCLSEEEVLAFSEGSLMPSEIDSVHAHLDWCPTCQELVNAAVHNWDHPPASFVGDRIWMATFGPGQMIASRYRIQRFLGRGGMGEVYSAFDGVLGERVALKTLLSTTSDNPHAVRRLFSEARLARRISHPNVCRVHDIGVHEEPGRVDERLHFLSMEFIDGKRLAQILRRGSMPLGAALSIARQVLAGLQAAHAAGVLHRDLKSDNIMVTGQTRAPRIVITDFGLSQALNGEARAAGTLGQARVGSVPYMAPEQILGHELGPETDVFGFGVVMFEMLCGRLPFLPQGDTLEQTALHRLTQRAVLPSSLRRGIPKALDAIVMHCLNERPRDRYAHAQQVLAALDGLAGQSLASKCG